MDTLRAQAARAGIETEHYDGLGRHCVAKPEVLSRVLDILGAGEAHAPILPPLVALRQDGGASLTLDAPAGCRIRWEIHAQGATLRGEAEAPCLPLPGDLPVGTWDLAVTLAGLQGERHGRAALLVSPPQAFQGAPEAPRRTWALAVQLYGVRSHTNWGHGDFTDLRRLVELAGALGASGIGLNPLHALFDERPQEPSPYAPNSRFFLNTLYIDVAAIPEFPGLSAALQAEVAALRERELVDHGGVAAAKATALRATHQAFRRRAEPSRRRAFAAFRRAQGVRLRRFAAFEVLRQRFPAPWWEWPAPWRAPDEAALAQLEAEAAEAMEYAAFVQWVADVQLAACRQRAEELGLPIGLYLDLAVGVRADGFDAWNDQDFVLPALEIGAPPDLLNTEGQKWGLAGFSPVDLARRACEPFRQSLRAAMRHAGAIRLDHVLGLNRLYVIPAGSRADEGVYIRFPFEALLAVIAQESVRAGCIVIGEDLGTVPPGFRVTLAAYGLWSYHVMMFERGEDGGFLAPEHYRENALVTFSTHDLPTFAGWRSGHDLATKRALGLDPGEQEHERAAARTRLAAALAARGLAAADYPAVAAFLAATPSRLMVVGMEDVLGLEAQANVPGTVDAHPNWRRRLPVALEELGRHPALRRIAAIAAQAGRKIARRGD